MLNRFEVLESSPLSSCKIASSLQNEVINQEMLLGGNIEESCRNLGKRMKGNNQNGGLGAECSGSLGDTENAAVCFLPPCVLSIKSAREKNVAC